MDQIVWSYLKPTQKAAYNCMAANLAFFLGSGGSEKKS